MGTVGIVILSIFGAILLIGIIIVLWAISVYNSLISMRNNADEGFSTMDVYLKKRYDLIPNLVETVKGYTKHETETLEKVVKARNLAMNATNFKEKMENEATLSQELKTLLNVVVEQYPDLKANQNFMELQSTLKQVETEIAHARKYYNGAVKVYNVKREVFPSNLIAKRFNFEKRELFEVEETEERKNVKVSF